MAFRLLAKVCQVLVTTPPTVVTVPASPSPSVDGMDTPAAAVAAAAVDPVAVADDILANCHKEDFCKIMHSGQSAR